MNSDKKLKLIQQIKGLSQEGLAQELGVSFPTINSWINARSQPRKKAQEKIDFLLEKITGQKIVSTDELDFKKKALVNFIKRFKDPLNLILTRNDIHNQFLLSLTYNSNRIEGSTLDEAETAAILFLDSTIPHKSMIEHLEVKNHEAALKFIFSYLKEKNNLTEQLILRLHGILMNGIKEDAGAFRNHGVRIVGSNVPTANFIKIPKLIEELIKKINHISSDNVKHISEMHSEFEKIHPFSDGNGRIGRLIINFMLLKENYPPAVIKQERRKDYINALNKSQLEDNFYELENFVADSIINGYQILEVE